MEMIHFQVSADVQEDHRIVLTLPPEVPTGQAELTITVASKPANSRRRPRASLVDCAEENSEHWGTRLDARDVESFTGRRF
jgi:hypothetical protein